MMLTGKGDVLVDGNSHRVAGDDPSQLLGEMRRKLDRRHDVIIVGFANLAKHRMSWNAFVPEFEEQILAKVEAGTGLVLNVGLGGETGRLGKILAGARDEAGEQYIASALPNRPADGAKHKHPPARCYRIGKGRLVLLGFAPTPPPPNSHIQPELYLDYQHSLLARSSLWAAQRQPNVRLAGVTLPDEPVSAGNFAAAPIEIQLSNRAKKDFVGQLQLVVHGWDGNSYCSFTQNVTIAAGESVVTHDLPRLAGGPQFVDVWLRKSEKIVDWYSGYVEIIPTATVSEIALTQPSFAVGMHVKGSVTVEGSLNESMQLEIRLVDSFGRVLGRSVRKLTDPPVTAEFSFDFDQPVAIQHKIVAELLDECGRIHQSQRIFVQRDVTYDDFMFVAWGAYGHNIPRQRMLARRCYELGADGAYLHFQQFEPDWNRNHQAYWTTAAGLSQFFYGTHLGFPRGSKVREPCLSDPAYIHSRVNDMSRLAKINRHMGGIAYSTGDEYWLSTFGQDICWSPHCMAAMTEWLKEKYESLDELNRTWQTDYTAWDQVKRITLDEAHASGNYAAWSQGRAHNEFVFANIHRLLRDAVEQQHPGAPVGGEGMRHTDTYVGGDIALNSDMVSILHGHERPTQPEYIRCFAEPGAVTGHWVGSYFDRNHAEQKMRWQPWYSLFIGLNSAWWWTVSEDPRIGPAGLMPDLTPSPQFDWMAQEIREIKRGAGKLLLNSNRLHDAIAVHYSMASMRALYSHPNPTGEDREHWSKARIYDRMGIVRSKVAWGYILEDLGLQYVHLRQRDIEKGALINDGYKVLIMPVSQSLTGREAEAIREFVRLGGTVIADLRPGVLDEVLNAASPGLLDDVFGIARPNGVQRVAQLDVELTIDGTPHHLPAFWVDGGVSLTGGKAATGTINRPVMIQNKFGQGQATLLNLNLADYYDDWKGEGTPVPDFRDDSRGHAMRAMIGSVLAGGGVRPRVQVLQKDGRPLIAAESVFFKSGESEYLGLLYKPGNIYFFMGDPQWIAEHYDLQPDISPVPILVKLDKNSHVYNVRNGRYVGYTDVVSTDIEPGEALLYSLLPDRIEKISLQGPSLVTLGQRGGYQVSVQDSGSTMHCFRVEVHGPDGESVRQYSQNVIAKSGATRFTVPFALSDTPGLWRIRVKDVATGVTNQWQTQLVEP